MGGEKKKNIVYNNYYIYNIYIIYSKLCFGRLVVAYYKTVICHVSHKADFLEWIDM